MRSQKKARVKTGHPIPKLLGEGQLKCVCVCVWCVYVCVCVGGWVGVCSVCVWVCRCVGFLSVYTS